VDDIELSPFHPGISLAAMPEISETHISVLFHLGDRVYKLKKPIQLSFLDWRERSAREAACHREVELNRRLSPDVYLGVVDLVADGVPLDHLVVMRRMPAERRLSRLVTDGVDVTSQLRVLADQLVAFHADAPRSPEINAAVGPVPLGANWDDNLEVLRASAGTILDAEIVERVSALAHRYIDGRAVLFEERAAAGCAVDGHGDLLADDIYLLDDGPRVLDCIEFYDDFRYVDVLDEVAFLAMDIERLGAPGLAAEFLTMYCDASGEHHPGSLTHHFIAYRASVRAKVACVRAGQGAESSTEDARQLLDLALRHVEASRVRLVLVGGLPGSGKSTVSTRLATETGWPVFHSDVVRKELAGIDPETSMAAGYHEGLYRPDHTAATYRSLLDTARQRLERGESVILDASWTDAAFRADAEALAETTSSDLVALRCVAPFEVASRRLRERVAKTGSDADPGVTTAMMLDETPWPESCPIDTTTTLEESLAAARLAIGP
jgi:aminoglycoside phosphotransferase family enzyme/predicted kinase